jgi:protein O-GlcNAc transferase
LQSVAQRAFDGPFTRSGASLMNNVGLPDLVAASPESYFRIACALAADRERLAGLRTGLRERMRASPLTDAKRFARDMEEAFTAMCETVARAARKEP